MKRKTFFKLTYLSLGLFFIMLAIIFATGSTFGQRCAKEYEVDSPEWCKCVDRLSNGEEIKTNVK